MRKLLAGSGVEPPVEMPYARHVYHVYAVRAQRRDALKEALHADGVDTGIHYPIPIHLLKAHADLGYKEGDFPEAERAAKETLSLPMFAELTEDQVRTVCDAVRKASWKKVRGQSDERRTKRLRVHPALHRSSFMTSDLKSSDF